MATSRTDRVLLLLLGVSLSFNVAQRGLPTWLTARISTDATSSAPMPLVGRLVGPLLVRTLNGTEVTLDTRGTPSVLYFIAPRCDWCKANTPVINAIFSGKRDEHRFIGLSMTADGLSEYLTANPLLFPVYAIPNPFDEQWSALRLGRTPYMIAVGAEGRIKGVWAGALATRNKSDVEQFFGVGPLPPLMPR